MDPGVNGWINVQDRSRIDLQTPLMMFDSVRIQLTRSFSSHQAVTSGTEEIDTTATEPFVGVRYFGHDIHYDLPSTGN